MAFKFVPYAPEGSGGKDPVLGELVVTKNGVYDEPVISNAPEPITWDGVIGDKITVDVGNGMTFVKVSDKALSAEDLVGATIVLLNTATTVLTSDMISSSPGGVVLPELAAVSVSDAEVFSAAMSVPFSETGTYFVYSASTGVYTESLTFPEGVSTPADGWNKVTVNVAGDIVDVAELPTENVDDSKIYRTTETLEPTGELYIVDTNMSDKPMAVNEYVEVVYEVRMNVTYYIVESLPETLLDSDRNTETYHVYIIAETGEAYVKVEDITYDFVTEWFEFDSVNRGVISSIDEATQDGYYFCMSYNERTIYGIPDKANTKETFEYTADGEWVARNGIIDVTELPTTNIKDGAAYRLSTESNMYVYESLFGKRYTLQEARPGAVLHIVEELPEQMIPGDYNDGGAWHVYVVESTGIGYYSTTGDPSTDLRTLSWCMLFPEWLGGNMGCIDSLDEITRDGFYFLRGADNVSMYTHSDDGWSGYINEGTYNAINEEKKEAIKNVTDLTVKCSAAVGYVTDEGLINFINAANCENGADGVEVTGTTDKNITSITIPSGVAVVGKEAFKEHTALTTVTLSEGVTKIKDSAFYGCTALTSVTFPSTFTGMYYEQAFADCTSMQYYDFTALSSRPYIGSSDMFDNIPAACQIRVADEVYDQWITYYDGKWKDHIVKASDVV